MAKAKKLPSGNWRVQPTKTINGIKTTQSFTAPTKKEAELLAIEWQNNQKRTTNRAEITLKEACEEYILLRQNIVSPVTIKTYQGYIKRYLSKYMTMNIKNIPKNALQMEFNNMAITLSAKTLKSIYGFFRAVLKSNDVDVDIKLPRLEKAKYNTPSQEIGRQLLLLSKGTDIELPITLALCYGLRSSEVCGLKWTNVYENHIYIDNVIIKFGNEVVEKKPKSAAGTRSIPIDEETYNLIMSLPKTSEYVYPANPGMLLKRFSTFLQKNNLPHMRFHDLRHGFASSMAAMGIPERYAMAIGGWDTSEILHSVYEQTFEKQQNEFMSKVSSFYK